MTLFGNILQNPQDPRARSDVRLMNLVVGFLSMLGTEEENGGVKRMLGVCSEFERIAKVVLDKSEKDTSSRRKRKTQEDQAAKAAQSSKSFVVGPPNAPPKTYSPAATFSSPAKWDDKPRQRAADVQPSSEWFISREWWLDTRSSIQRWLRIHDSERRHDTFRGSRLL